MSEPWPLFDLFLDLPHPAASPACAPPFIIGSPESSRSESIEKELGEAASIARIARFAFPEYDDQAPPPPQPPPGGAGLNRYDVYVTQGFQEHAFSLQLSSGQRVHGHVRRYLPTHREAPQRYDVGRRGVRALVILSRASGGDLLYSAMLKTVEAISAMQAATPKDWHPHPRPQENFLHTCHTHHNYLCRVYAQKPHDDRKPMLMSVEGLEYGSPLFAGFDTSRFLLPSTLLQPPSALSPTSSTTESPILPLLRCLGVPNTLRLLSALLSERRVLMISSSPTRLSTCARSALSMLGQGMLHWQHLFIPVLPPHLLQYLAAPMPYLIGVQSTLQPKLDQMQELGEVLLIYLDASSLETRGIATQDIVMKIPDFFRSPTTLDAANLPSTMETSAADLVARDLVELLKVDKRTMTGDSALQNVGETAAKATKAVKSAFGKIKKKGRQYLQQRSSLSDYDEPATPPPEPQDAALSADEIYAQGCQNPVGEEEARIAFATFFLCLYGDMKWYLGGPPGQLPQFDAKRFMEQKRARGDGEGSPMYPLLANMCHSQMFEQFVKERVEEVRMRVPVTKDSPLFLMSANYLRSQNAEFSLGNVRNVTRQMAQAHPSRIVSQANANARRLAMSLTSNKAYEGNQAQSIAQLVEVAHEATSVLFDIMSVLWMRIKDSRGMQWKHGLLALQIMRNLLYHGPPAAIAEATDGLDKIRAMKKYTDNIRPQAARQIQVAAAEIYILLVDRVKLFSLRRRCADRRRALKSPPKGRLMKDTRLRVTTPFKQIHALLHPNAQRQVAPEPGGARQPAPMAVAAAPAIDLLGFSSPPDAVAQPADVPVATVPSADDELLGIFEAQANIGGAPSAAAPQAPTASAAQSNSQPLHASAATLQHQLPTPPSRSPVPLQQPGAPPQQTLVAAPAFAQQPSGAMQKNGAGPAVPQFKQYDPFGQQAAVVPQQQQLTPPRPQQHQVVPVPQHPRGPPPPQGMYSGISPQGAQLQQPAYPQQQPPPYHPSLQSPPPGPGVPQQPYPTQQQAHQMPLGYPQPPPQHPGQPPAPNMFASPPPPPQPQQPRKNLSQFDPMAR